MQTSAAGKVTSAASASRQSSANSAARLTRGSTMWPALRPCRSSCAALSIRQAVTHAPMLTPYMERKQRFMAVSGMSNRSDSSACVWLSVRLPAR